jgi:hypothetical protein
MKRPLLGMLAVAMLSQACTTAEGPRLPLPPQGVSTPVPAGYVRVVFFNDTFEALNWATGTIRIQINGQTAPSLYLNHYAQLFLRPGKYELMLEHWDVFKFTDRFQVEITPPESVFRVWTTPLGNKYEILETLPPDFESRFIGGRDPSEWPMFIPNP